MHLWQVEKQEKVDEEAGCLDLRQIQVELGEGTVSSPDERMGGPEAPSSDKEEEPGGATYIDKRERGSPLAGEVLPNHEAEGALELSEDPGEKIEDRPEKPEFDLPGRAVLDEMPNSGDKTAEMTGRGESPAEGANLTSIPQEALIEGARGGCPEEGEETSPGEELPGPPKEAQGVPWWAGFLFVGGVLLLGAAAARWGSSTPREGPNREAPFVPVAAPVTATYVAAPEQAPIQDLRLRALPPGLQERVRRGEIGLDEIIVAGAGR